MISRQLVDLINSGESIAIVGSGVSTESGVPAWATLFDRIADELDGESRETAKARAVAKKSSLPQAFDLLAAQTSREDIHKRTGWFELETNLGGWHPRRIAPMQQWGTWRPSDPPLGRSGDAD